MQGYVALYVILIIAAVLSFFRIKKNNFKIESKGACVVNILIALLFSLSICLYNYNLFDEGKYFVLLIIFLLSAVSFWLIITAVSYSYAGERVGFNVKAKRTWVMPLIAFVSVLIVQLVHLIMCTNPAWIQFDTVYQIDQIMSGHYTNHSPIFQTFFLKVCISIAYLFGNGITEGLFIYAVCQIVLFAIAVAYMIDTIIKKKRDLISSIIVLIIFLVVPYHFMYASYVVKDIIFTYCGMMCVTAFYRITSLDNNHKYVDYIVFALTGLGLSLFRNNGIFVFICMTIVLVFLKFNVKKVLLIVSVAVVLVSLLLKGPFLKTLNIEQTQFSEALSIPIQQVSRVVAEDGNLSEQDIEMINELMPVEDIKKEYVAGCSDPIKGIIQFHERDDYFEEHKWDYFNLWVRVGVNNIGKYISAYVDQTYGYWIPTASSATTLVYEPYGYSYEEFHDVDFGIRMNMISQRLNDFFNKIVLLWENNKFLQIFYSIGAFFWLAIIILVKAIRERSVVSYIISPVIALVLTCCLATPLCAELRYCYMVFCIIPFALWILLSSKD